MRMNASKYLLLMFFSLCVFQQAELSAQTMRPRGEQEIAPRESLPAENDAEEEFREPRPRRGAGFLGERFEQRRTLRRQRIERARNLARRLLNDPNTSVEAKTKAQRLDNLLTEREALEDELAAKRQTFLRDHRQELDELRQLRERAEVLRQNLRSAREKAIADNLPQIQNMRRLTQEARQTARELRQQFRGLRGGRGQEPEDN